MRRLLLVLLIVPFVLAAGEKKPQKRADKPKAAAKAESGPPKGAKEVEPNVWVHTDPRGKTWEYRKTPFGWSKNEPTSPSEPKADGAEEELPLGMTATEDGESVTFERKTPFGPARWTKKKAELTEEERKVWERDSRKKAGASANE